MGEARILLRDAADASAIVPAEVERKLTVLELLWNDGFVRKSVIIIFLAAAWEIYGTVLNNPLLFPTFHDTILTMFDKVRDGTIPLRAWASLKVLFMGYAAGIILAAIFTILAISTRIGTDFLETVTAMFNPLPAIALLPLALIWFGLGNGSLVFVLIHSVLWPVALNTHSGFMSVSPTMRSVFDTLLKPEWVLSATGHNTEWISTNTRLPLPSPNQISASGRSAIAGRGLNMAVIVSRKSEPMRVLMARMVNVPARRTPAT